MPRKILCVDDDRGLCRILSRALGAEGYRVLVAHDGETAIETAAREAPDLVLLDVMMPRGSGFDVLAAIRAMDGPVAAIPAVLMTGAARTQAWVDRARELRARALLKKPVPLEDLLARVSRYLDRKRRPVGARKPVARGKTRRSPLRGSLEDLPFPALLHRVHGLRASGVLHLRSGRKLKSIELRDGRPAAVRSNLMRERLGEMLLRAGRIARTQLEESARRMQRGEGLQGEALVAMEVLDETELADLLRGQAEEKLFEIFEWTQGSFELLLGKRLDTATALALSPADLVVRGVRTRFPLAGVDRALRAHADDVAVVGETPFYRFQDIELGAEEQALVGECRKGLPVRSLLARPAETRRAACALLELGLLELREGSFRSATARGSRTRGGARSRPRSAPVAPKPPPRPPAPTVDDGDDHSHYAADADERAALTQLVERLRTGNPFTRLGLTSKASEEEIRRAYARLAKETHPDRYANASDAVISLSQEAFQAVAKTYESLSDPARLAAYRADPDRDAREARELEEGYRALAAEQEFQKGEARLRARDWPGALAHFEKAVELYGEEGEYHAYSGWAYYLTHGHDLDVLRESFGRVKRGAKQAPDREKPLLFLGRLYQAGGRLDQAERMFAAALERRPDSIEAQRELRLLQMRHPKPGRIARLLGRGRRGRG